MRFVIVLRKMLLSLNKQKIYKKKNKKHKITKKKLKSRKSFDEKFLFFTKKDPKKETKILN